jgi:hypothetical protein
MRAIMPALFLCIGADWMQIKFGNKTFSVKESVKNTRRAYAYQKKVLELYKGTEGIEDDTDATLADISATSEALDVIISYLIDIIGEEKVTADFFEENVNVSDLRSAAEKVTKKLIGAEDGESGGKKSATTKQSKESTSSAES